MKASTISGDKHHMKSLRPDVMKSFRQDVRELISVNERIQSALMQGERMTADEMEVIQMCANELLTNISNRLRDDNQSRLEQHTGVSAGDLDGQSAD